MILKNISKNLRPFFFAFQIKQTIAIINNNTPGFVNKLQILKQSSPSTFKGNLINGVSSRLVNFDYNKGEICMFESNFIIDLLFNVFQGNEEQTQYLKDSQKPIMYIMKNDVFQRKK